MSTEQLDAFLKGGEAAPEPTQEPPEPSPAPVTEPEAPEAPATPQEQPEGEQAEPGEVNNFTRLRQAVDTTKREREDWKVKAIRAETERDELRKQVEAAQRPQPAAEQQQPPSPEQRAREEEAFRYRLDASEMLLRRDIGDDKVVALQEEFIAAQQADPSLYQRLKHQPDPYKWALQQMEAIRLQKEIGDNPAAYRERVRAELEAEIMAKGSNGNGAPAPRVSPAAGMAPSLASARSAAPRSAPAWTGEPSLAQILAERGRR